MDSPMAVPPGSRVTRNGTPAFSSLAVNRCTWVDFPQPSEPSKVMNGNRTMVSIFKQRSTIVELCSRFAVRSDSILSRIASPTGRRLHCVAMKNFWLVKQEPSDYSWTDFVGYGGKS